jgi:hypothetical protein
MNFLLLGISWSIRTFVWPGLLVNKLSAERLWRAVRKVTLLDTSAPPSWCPVPFQTSSFHPTPVARKLQFTTTLYLRKAKPILYCREQQASDFGPYYDKVNDIFLTHQHLATPQYLIHHNHWYLTRSALASTTTLACFFVDQQGASCA